MTSSNRAPVRPSRVRAGAVLLVLVAGAAACDERVPGQAPQVLELADDTIRLSGGVRLHEITLRARAANSIEPARIDANAGDVLRFVASDALGYSVRFETGRMSAEATAFLDETNQLASPPLLGQGAAWVVTLDRAPAGEYPFVSAGHGPGGVVVVR